MDALADLAIADVLEVDPCELLGKLVGRRDHPTGEIDEPGPRQVGEELLDLETMSPTNLRSGSGNFLTSVGAAMRCWSFASSGCW